MKNFIICTLTASLMCVSCTESTQVNTPPNSPAKTIDLPESPLSFMYGEWRGTAKGMSKDGPYSVTQTERVGPMLDGKIIVVEGRGYKENGDLAFNAFAVISYDTREKTYYLNAYKDDMAGKFELDVTSDGFTWTIPAGPNASIVNTATIKGSSWHEVTKYVPKEGPERITNDMTLTRIGGTYWPSESAVTPKAD